MSSDDRMRDALVALADAESAAQGVGDADLVAAARVGQARAHLWLKEYSEAAAAAASVPPDFEFKAYYSNNTVGQYNRVADVTHALNDVIRWSVGDGTITAVGNEKWPYFDEWVSLGLLQPRPDLESFNPIIPVVYQMKYVTGDAPIVVASGAEAQLIIAEQKLRAGSLGEAETILNGLRADPWGLGPITLSGNAERGPAGAGQGARASALAHGRAAGHAAAAPRRRHRSLSHGQERDRRLLPAARAGDGHQPQHLTRSAGVPA